MSKSKRKMMMVVVGLILTAAGAATAGSRYLGGGIRMGRFSDGTGYAAGVLSHVRASADSYQKLSCGSNGTFGSCIAFPHTNESGISCTTQDPGMLAAIRSINGDSYVFFQADTAGNCITVSVTQSSEFAPKLN